MRRAVSGAFCYLCAVDYLYVYCLVAALFLASLFMQPPASVQSSPVQSMQLAAVGPPLRRRGLEGVPGEKEYRRQRDYAPMAQGNEDIGLRQVRREQDYTSCQADSNRFRGQGVLTERY